MFTLSNDPTESRRQRKSARPGLTFFVLPLLLALTGCASQTPPEPYESVSARITAGEEVSAATLRRSFLNSPDFPTRLQKIGPLEQQVMQMIDDEPLRLGSIGSAVLDIYYGSLAGHYAMRAYYERVGADDAVATHEAWLGKLIADLEAGGDGTMERPYRVISATEARAYLRSKSRSAVGSMYQTSDARPFGMVTLTKPESGPLVTSHFDLQPAFEAVRHEVDGPDGTDFSPELLIRYLAGQNDSAAQAAIGTFFALSGDSESAINWLHAASRPGNLLANLMLARVHWQRADDAEGDARDEEFDRVLDNYLHAIALGSDEAMLRLGTLYLAGVYGEDNEAAGIPLLNQADELGNNAATLYLGHLYYSGEVVEQEYARADSYYKRAAEAGELRERTTYVRFLLDDNAAEFGNEQAITLLEASGGESAEANILLGYSKARGLGVAVAPKAAVAHFKQAVDLSPGNADIINEVAWTLTVSHIDELRRERYALNIMTEMMEADEVARANPAFLDTWAAAHAANGDFDRAISIQTEALASAQEAGDEAVIEELESHMALFREGGVVIDPVP
ncbi:MAG: sel1 repeat family protein [Pseudomonadaceae bacterium]|nr:sel1 repeat family protein [Pseudomonadaceae bacterium]